MDTLEIAYKILDSLENRKKADYMGLVISPEKLKVDPGKWADVLQTLTEEGYVDGVSFRENILGERIVDIENARITLQGVQYLKENSTMARFRKLATNIITVTSNMV